MMRNSGGNRRVWLKVMTGLAAFGFYGQAFATGDILTLRGDNGAFGIAEVTIPDCTNFAGGWAPVTVTNLQYGTEIVDGSSTPSGSSLSAPAGSPNAERACADANTPGTNLRAAGGGNLVFTGTPEITLADNGVYTGDNGGTYTVRAPIGGTAPEPGSIALFAIGLGAARLASRRRSK